MPNALPLAATRTVTVVSLASLAALHVAWAAGSSWPAADRAALADAIGGFSDVPGPIACGAVAALLALAAACVAGRPQTVAPLARAGSGVVAFVLSARGAAGIAGVMPHDRRSARFAALNRRVYSPICIALGLASLAGVARR
jgi:hypothetical protein